MKPLTQEAYQLLHDSSLVLARAERNGIHVDVDYCKRATKHLERRLKRMREELNDSEIAEIGRKTYGFKFNIGSDEQLAHILFDVMELESSIKTAKGKNSVNAESLQSLHLPALDTHIRIKKLEKAKDTYLANFLKEAVDGYMHPFFNLNNVVSFRSCVAKGSKILVAHSFKEHPEGVAIEDVKVGDCVYCFDNELNPQIQKVLWSGKTGHREVIRIHWSSRGGGGKGHLDVTPEHKIRLIDGSYVEAQNLIGDFRKSTDSKRIPKIRTLACKRVGDSLRFSGHLRYGNGLLEHRFLYSKLVGQLNDAEIIHHKDGDHTNHSIGNLEKMTLSNHSKLHAINTIMSPKARAKNKEVIKRNWAEGKYPVRMGKDVGNYLDLSKRQCLKMLSNAAGRASKVPVDFNTFKKYLQEYEINHIDIRLRYDKEGNYVSRGKLKRMAHKGRAAVSKELGIGHARLIKLYEQYGISTKRKWGNQFGKFIPGNHIITKIEWLGDIVDVYDLEIENHHNFIANEICVHNSSSDPNFQNIPNRDPEIRAICRKAIIPRPGRKLCCMDFSGVEVRIGTAYHKDPTMIKYNSDPTTDMHRDMAKEIYMIDDAMWDWIVKETPKNAKMIRHSGKNEFVFPEFYGDWYKSCGPNLYRSAGNDTHILPDGMLLTEWLARNGMPDYAAFEKHMAEVERRFWYDRFLVYTEWKEKWWKQYLKKGYFDTLTGFRCQGVMDRKQAGNYPVQGSAFHATLYSLIEIDKVIEDNRLDTMIIGQIHDEGVMDLVVEEEEFLLKECKHIMTKKIREHWGWINVPIDVEIEVTPIDGSWLEKEEIEI